MNNGEQIIRIISEIEKLDYESKMNVLSKIVNQLKQEGKKKKQIPVTRLKGLGKKIWQQTDINSYLSTERGSWE